jgi:predicted dehydrogenase
VHTTTVRVAITGFGFMGKTHYTRYQKIEGVEVSAICDLNSSTFEADKLESTGNIDTLSGEALDLHNVTTYGDYSTLLAKGGFDVVDICLPSYMHQQHVIDALDAGYHVFCEKPIALSNEGAQRILAKVGQSDRCFGVGHSARYSPAYVQTKKTIDAGTYGRLRYAEFRRFSAPPAWAWDNWIVYKERSGGAALDIHIHDVDMILYLFGHPKNIKSAGLKNPDGNISQISTVYSYDNKLVTSTGGWICSKSFGFRSSALFVLEEATIELDSTKQNKATVFPDDGESFALELSAEDGYYYELMDFINYVATGKHSGVVTPTSSAESLRLCLEEIKSAEEDRQISIDNDFGVY